MYICIVTEKIKIIMFPQEEKSKLYDEALDIAVRCGIQLGTWKEEALKELIVQLNSLSYGLQNKRI